MELSPSKLQWRGKSANGAESSDHKAAGAGADADGDGFISETEAVEAFVAAGSTRTDAENSVHSLFQALRPDTDTGADTPAQTQEQRIQIHELELGVLMLSTASTVENPKPNLIPNSDDVLDDASSTNNALWWIFQTFDFDNNGHLSEEEFSTAIQLVYKVAGRVCKINNEEQHLDDILSDPNFMSQVKDIASASFQAADADGDGKVTYQEFGDWLTADSGDASVAGDVRRCLSFLGT